MFLNTPIRCLVVQNVTEKWPVLVVRGVFVGKSQVMVGENCSRPFKKTANFILKKFAVGCEIPGIASLLKTIYCSHK
jgi:hypothetical protein